MEEIWRRKCVFCEHWHSGVEPLCHYCVRCPYAFCGSNKDYYSKK